MARALNTLTSPHHRAVLSYDELAPLRLRHLLDADAQVVEHDQWRWMCRNWWYEGIGFTWFGRPMRARTRTAAFELSLQELSVTQLAVVSAALALPVRHGMTLPEVIDLFGPTVGTQRFVPDRLTHEFRVTSRSAYAVTATIQDDVGLVHVSALPAAWA